jgi:hypothetical protein
MRSEINYYQEYLQSLKEELYTRKIIWQCHRNQRRKQQRRNDRD